MREQQDERYPGMIADDLTVDQFPVSTIVVDWGSADAIRARRAHGRWKGFSRAEATQILAVGRIVRVNAKAMRLLGAATPEEIVKARCFRGPFVAWFQQAVEALDHGDFIDFQETTIHDVSGRQLPVMSSLRSVHNRSGDFLLASFLDIGRLKDARDAAMEAVEAAEQANRFKSDFLAMMSHEIRTPLNGVMGMTQLLLRQEMPRAQKEMVGIISQCGDALLTILNDVLDLAKIEAGKLALENTEFDLAELLDGVHGAFQGVAAEKKVALDLVIEPVARGRYLGDPTRLRQILCNLVSNALKFTEEGRVRIRAGRSDGLVLRVEDTGIGIPADRLPHLFDRFVQAETSTARRFGGSGLGLSICRDLAGLMDGVITAESEEGVGSRFTLVAPLPRVGRALSETPGWAPDDAPHTLDRPLRILAAEDNEVNQLVLRTLLDAVGAELLIVNDGVKALAALETLSFDLVLMDIEMPEMNGVDAVRELRRREGARGLARTPVLALSANAMVHQVAQYLDAGMDGHVEKPIRLERLLAEIGAHVRASAEPDASEAAACA